MIKVIVKSFRPTLFNADIAVGTHNQRLIPNAASIDTRTSAQPEGSTRQDIPHSTLATVPYGQKRQRLDSGEADSGESFGLWFN